MITTLAFGDELIKLGKKLTSAGRKRVAKKNFALPKTKGKAGKGSYPIHDISHARNALSRVSQFGSPAEQAAVRAKVYAKYPGLRERVRE